jgi:predicted phage-related endonuclease
MYDKEEWIREHWLKERKNYIGGSDLGAIAGLNPYSVSSSNHKTQFQQ